MSNEFGQKLEKYIMDEHWKLVQEKPYPMFKGVWENRDILPTTHSYDFGKTLNEPLEIPLLGGGYIRLGKTAAEDPEISVDIKFPTAKGEMSENGFIITQGWGEESQYPFWISYDSEDQDERMKFLARMKPEKDIDWESIKPESREYKIAQAMCL